MDEKMEQTPEVTYSEHPALVFKMNRKEAASVARYIREHSSAAEMIFAVDLVTKDLQLLARNADEEDFIELHGEEDVFDVEESEVEMDEE